MYDYNSLRKVIYTLAVAFVVVLAVLLLSCRPLGGFAIISALFMVVIAAYFVLVPLRLLKEMQDMEKMIDNKKNKNNL